MKEKCLCISLTLGPFESKVFTHYICCWGALWKQSSLLIHYSCYRAPLKARNFTHYSCKGDPRQVPRLPSHTLQYITLTMILYENMKPTENVLLHPIWVLSHLMYACKHCNVKWSSYYWTHWSCWWVYYFKKDRRFFKITPRHTGRLKTTDLGEKTLSGSPGYMRKNAYYCSLKQGNQIYFLPRGQI